MKNKFLRLLPLIALLAACSETQPNVESPSYLLGLPLLNETWRNEAQLAFPRFQAGTAPIIRETSFYAKVGTQREVTLNYANGDVFLRFGVGPASLLRKPNGALFLPGDSVQITVSLDDS